MTSLDATTDLPRGFRIHPLVRVALVAVVLSQLLTGRVRGAEDAADPYDVLYDVIMVRMGYAHEFF